MAAWMPASVDRLIVAHGLRDLSEKPVRALLDEMLADVLTPERPGYLHRAKPLGGSGRETGCHALRRSGRPYSAFDNSRSRSRMITDFVQPSSATVLHCTQPPSHRRSVWIQTGAGARETSASRFDPRFFAGGVLLVEASESRCYARPPFSAG